LDNHGSGNQLQDTWPFQFSCAGFYRSTQGENLLTSSHLYLDKLQ